VHLAMLKIVQSRHVGNIHLTFMYITSKMKFMLRFPCRTCTSHQPAKSKICQPSDKGLRAFAKFVLGKSLKTLIIHPNVWLRFKDFRRSNVAIAQLIDLQCCALSKRRTFPSQPKIINHPNHHPQSVRTYLKRAKRTPKRTAR
jgi:hypothetical protein